MIAVAWHSGGMTEPVQAETVALAVMETLQSGPLAVDALLSRLAAKGLSLSAEDLAELHDREYLPLVCVLLDDRLADIGVLLKGKAFTHRLSATEIEHDLLAIAPDLEPVALLTDDPDVFEIDDTVTDVIADDPRVAEGRALPVATGRLAGTQPGDLIGLRVRPGGATLDLAPEPAATPGPLLAKLRNVVRDDDDEIRPVLLFDAVLQLCADDPDLFAVPLAPLSEIVESAGLATWGDYLAPAGFDVRGWIISGDVEAIASIYGLSSDIAMAIVEVGSDIRTRALLSTTPRHSDERQELVAAATDTVLRALHLPDVASALSVEALKGDDYAVESLSAWVDRQRTLAPPRARAALLWLKGTAVRRAGEMIEAEGNFQSALDLDSHHRPALLDLADIASDRGERERAVSLLRRADLADDDPMLVLLESLGQQAGPQLGRNDPCWCGSGRKFKQCHLNRPPELSPSDRARWLYFKATSFVNDATFQSLLLDLAAMREPARSDPEDGLPDGLDNDPLATDLALFEGGGLEEFLAQRSALLPEADLDMATSWLAVSRSVYEVQSTGSGVKVTLRDLRSGDSVEVGGHLEMAPITPGRRLCLRPLPVGAELRVFGGVEPVSDERTDSLIELLDEIDEALDDHLAREIPDELVEVVAGMDAADLAQAVAVAARQLAETGTMPGEDTVDDEDERDELEDELEEGDRRWAALALMAALCSERSTAG